MSLDSQRQTLFFSHLARELTISFRAYSGDIIELLIGMPIFLPVAGIFFWGIIEIYRKREWTKKATMILVLSIVQYVGFRWGYLFFAHLIRP